MRLFKSSETKGVVGLILIILGIGAVLLITTGKLETWFGFTWGPRALDRIIYVSDSSGSPRIYSIKTDGSDRKELTGKDTRVLSPPAISPLGNRIAFIGLVENNAQIMVIGAEGGSPEQITATETPKKAVGYSPDGDYLSYIASGRVYVSGIGGDNPDVVLPTEREEHQAMADPVMRGEVPPYGDFAWGPDSVKMAGVTKGPDGSDVLVYLPKPGGEATQTSARRVGAGYVVEYLSKPGGEAVRIDLVIDQAKIAGIAWGAKKAVLAASINCNEGGVVAIFDAKSETLAFGLFRGSQVGRPAVSPDGSAVVVPFMPLSGKGASGLARLAARSDKRDTIARGVFASPSYSPKGDAILAVKYSADGKRRDLVRIDPSSGKMKQLTRDGGAMAAIWSPVSGK